MSTSLSSDAPVEDLEAGSVESDAPSSESEVDGTSVGKSKPDMVEASRFNGLMSALNKEKAEKAALEAELANLQRGTNTVTDDNVALEEIRNLRAELAAERLENAKAKVLEEFPQAKLFADLIMGDSPQELREVAKVLAERVALITPTQTAGAETEKVVEGTPVSDSTSTSTEEHREVAPTGASGGGSVDDEVGAGERVSEAIAKGDWSAYLSAKFEAQQMSETVGQ